MLSCSRPEILSEEFQTSSERLRIELARSSAKEVLAQSLDLAIFQRRVLRILFVRHDYALAGTRPVLSTSLRSPRTSGGKGSD
jgi:hypothetical protein